MSTKLYNEYDQDIALALTKNLVDQIELSRRNCTTCIHFTESNEQCSKATPPVRPPARVIVTGCKLWDDIPF